MTELCRLLEWDSAFFGMGIARVREGVLTETDAQAVRDWCASHAIDCAYYLADASDSESARAAASVGFRAVDTRLTLEAEAKRAPSPAPSLAVRAYRADDLAALQAIARVSHSDTRFYFDGRFPRDRCDALYAAWIARDAERGAIFAAEYDGGAAGYITCTVTGEHGEIGLLGVADVAQGRGFGGALIGRALAYFAEHGCTRIQVVTQGRNLRAQRAYLRAGFLPMRVETWFHL